MGHKARRARNLAKREARKSRAGSNKSRLQATLTKGLKASGVDFSPKITSRQRTARKPSEAERLTLGPRIALQPKEVSRSLTARQIEDIKSGRVRAPPELTEAVRAGKVSVIDDPLIGQREKAAVGTFLQTEGIPALIGLGGAAIGGVLRGGLKGLGKSGTARNILTNDFWKGANAARSALRASRGLEKIASRIATPVGQLTKRGDVISNVQTNSKVRKFIADILKKVFTSKDLIVSTNPSTGKVTTTIVEKTRGGGLAVIATIGALAYLIEKSIGGRNFAKFLSKEEAGQGTRIVMGMAQFAGNYEEYILASDRLKEVYTQTDSVVDYIPHLNLAKGIAEFTANGLRDIEAMDKIMLDKLEAEENGLSQVDEARLRDQEKNAMIKESADYNFELQKQLIELRAAARRRGDRDAARIWADQAAEQRVFDAEEREQIRIFWLDYWVLKLRLQEESRPSKLNFGIV